MRLSKTARYSLLMALALALPILWIVLREALDSSGHETTLVGLRYQRWQDGERPRHLLSSDDVEAALGFDLNDGEARS